MRMWMIDPRILCKNHLIGEHYELHKLYGNIRKNRSIKGYIRDGLCEVHSIKSRHEELVVEILKRGYTHNSPLPDFETSIEGKVDREKSYHDLLERCPSCKERYLKLL